MSTALWKLLKTRPVSTSVETPMVGVKIHIRSDSKGEAAKSNTQLASIGVSETERELLGMPLEIIDWTSESNVDRHGIESKLSAFLGVSNWNQEQDTTRRALSDNSARFVSNNSPKKRVQLMILPSSGPAMLPEMMAPIPYPSMPYITIPIEEPRAEINKSAFANHVRNVLSDTKHLYVTPGCGADLITKIMFDKMNDYLNNMPVAYRGRVIYTEEDYQTAVCASVSTVEGLLRNDTENEKEDSAQVFILHFGNTTALSGYLGTCLDPFVRTNKHWKSVTVNGGGNLESPNTDSDKWVTADDNETANFDEFNQDEQSEITDHVQNTINTSNKYVMVDLEDTQSTNAFINMPINGDGVSIVVSDAHKLVNPVWDKLRQKIMNAKDARIILLTHLPSEREPCELATLVNLAVGTTNKNENETVIIARPIKKHTRRIKRAKNGKRSTLRSTLRSTQSSTLSPTNGNSFIFLPETTEEFNISFVDTVGFALTSVETLRKRLTGVIAYLPCANSIPPEMLAVRATTSVDGNLYQIIPCPLTDFQEQAYLAYMKNTSDENKIIEGQRICQFAYPNDIPSSSSSDEEMITKLLRERMSDVFSAKQLADVYSPKYHETIARILHPGHVGCHIVYVEKSSTNFKLALETNGFVEMKLERKSESASASAGRLPWALAETSLMSPESPRFLCLNTTTVETTFTEQSKILRAIFNSEWENVPQNILDQLKQMYANSSMPRNEGTSTADMEFTNNHYGQVVKVCVLEDSAEYVNRQQSLMPVFKNTRFLHFMDCCQNISRMDTVVNNVIHACSHTNLPRELQTIQAWVYVSIFGDNSKTSTSANTGGINSLFDNNRKVTADEHVMENAFARYKIRQEIVRLFASMDE